MAPPEGRAAVFLDRDGVLNEDRGYVYRPEDLVLLAGAADALAQLKRAGYLLLVVTNQSGVARGLFDAAAVERFHGALDRALRAAGGTGVDAYYYCPHHPDGRVPALAHACACRKPAPGMVQTAAREHTVALGRSFLVGDKPGDIECALRSGVTGIQVARADLPRHGAAAAVVASLAEAVPLILGSGTG